MKKLKRLLLLSLLIPFLLTNKSSFAKEEDRKVETVELKEVEEKEESIKKTDSKKEEKETKTKEESDSNKNKDSKKEKVVYKFTSQAEAEKIVGKLKAGKKYILREVKAPEGYQKAKDIEFIVRKDGVEQEIKVVNQKIEKEIPKKKKPMSKTGVGRNMLLPFMLLVSGIGGGLFFYIRRKNTDKID